MALQAEAKLAHGKATRLGWPLWTLFCLPLLYLLSSGPVMDLYGKGVLPVTVVKIYVPLFWCSEKSRPFAVVYWSYLRFCGFYPLD